MEGPGGQMSAMSVMSESAPTTRCDSLAALDGGWPRPHHALHDLQLAFALRKPAAHGPTLRHLVKPVCQSQLGTVRATSMS